MRKIISRVQDLIAFLGEAWALANPYKTSEDVWLETRRTPTTVWFRD